ncbi:unnamed protein product [Amaranthus hypochondriacus]
MKGFLSCKSLPPGFRFHPTDEELFMYHLKRKVLGKSLSPEIIAEVDVYQFAPWDLPAMASLKSRDLNWFFFCPRAKKYPNGGRANRATDYGYWKSTGNDRTMIYNSRPVGKIKTLIFHKGKPPKGERTDWVMHEYRLEDKNLADEGVPQDCYVICKIYKKSGLGPKNGEHYGARFVEEEWESDDDDNVLEKGSESLLYDTNGGHVVDSPDGAVSVLTDSVITPNSAIAANLPIAVAPPPIVSTAFVGTQCINAASEGTPYVTDSGRSTPVVLNACTPYVTDTCTTTPNVSNPSVGSLGDFTSVNPLDALAYPMGSTSRAEISATPYEDEIDRLLSHFSETIDEEAAIFNGLGDLSNSSAWANFDWNDMVTMDDLK